MNDRYIERGWEAYRRLLLSDAKLNEIELAQHRQSYFAGANILMETVMHVMDSDREPTPKDLQVMTDIDAELSEFGQQIDRRYLGAGASHTYKTKN